jgi:hypothetical protein
MDDVKINTSKTLTLTLPSDPASNVVSVSLYHEFGSLVSGPTNATRTGAGVFTITYDQSASGIYILNSSGKHRADFTYTISGTSYTQSQYINVYTPYYDVDTFFDDHPEYEDEWYDKFDALEKKARNIINTFCGQSFDYYPNKYFILNGNGKRTLHLPLPIVSLSKVTLNIDDDDETVLHDSTDSSLNNIEKSREQFNFNSSYYIQWKNSWLDSVQTLLVTTRFNYNDDYKIEGNFGWQYVPNNIEQAAELLILDLVDTDSDYVRRGISSLDMDILKVQFNDSIFDSTTGNLEVDTLLMDYTLFVMDYVV